MNSENFPAVFKSASASSDRAQSHFYWCLGINLICLVISVLMSNITPTSSSVSLIQAFVLIIGLASMLYLKFVDPQGDWYAARALAESVKTMTWRFCMKVDPYRKGDAVSHFVDNIGKVLKDNAKIGHKIADLVGKQVPEELKKAREYTINERKKIYETYRIQDQLNWYLTKSAINARRAKQFFTLIFGLYVFAISFAIVRIQYPQIEYWYVDVATAIAGSALAWLQAKKHQELSASYGLTAHEIGLLVEKLGSVRTEDDFSSFVGDAENAFSREHTQWRARRDVE